MQLSANATVICKIVLLLLFNIHTTPNATLHLSRFVIPHKEIPFAAPALQVTKKRAPQNST
jgi:hypothetical protein